MGKGKRRANGEGSVNKLPDGRWAASVMMQRPDGGYTRIKREAKTRGEAVAKLAEAKRAVENGAHASGRLPTVAEHLEAWFRDSISPKVRPNSRRTYQSIIEGQITPFLGGIRIDKLTPPRLRAWLAELSRKTDDREPYSPKTIALARSVLRQALDQAVEDRLIAHNPITRRISGPKVPTSSGKALTVEQARALLAAARGHRLEVAIRLTLGLGLRRGEVCGLRWVDTNFEAGTLTVRGQLISNVGEGLEWVEPKTPTAVRVLRLPAVLLGALRWHQTRQEAERKVMGWEASPYIFTSVSNGGPLPPSSLYDAFRGVAEEAGLQGFRLHDLRHSAASMLLAEGVPLKRVQAILGHARGSTTLNVYGHLIPTDTDDSAERLQNRLDEEKNKPLDQGEKAAEA